MFNNRIEDVELGEDYAAACVPGLDFTGNFLDKSIQATARALLAGKVSEENPLSIRAFRVDRYGTDDKTRSIERYMDAKFKVKKIDNSVNFFYGVPENIMSELSAKMEAAGCVEQKDIKDFLKVFNFVGRVFVSEEKHTSFVMTAQDSLRVYHIVQSVFPRLVPWLIPAKKENMPQFQLDLIKSLTERKEDSYLALIREAGKQFDIRKLKIEKMCKNYGKNIVEREYNAAKTSYDQLQEEARSYMERYARAIRKAREYDIRMRGIRAMGEEEIGQEMAQFFAANKSIDLTYVSDDGNIAFFVNSYLNYWDPDVYETMIKNKDSHFYYRVSRDELPTGSPFKNSDNIRKLFDGVFGDMGIRIRMGAYFNVDTLGKSVSVNRHEAMPAKYQPCVTNPHFYFYGCLGGNQPAINDFLRNGNVEGALTQCVVAAQTVDVGESTSMGDFVHQLIHDQPVCFELPDGRVVNANDCLAYIEEKKA